MKYLYGDLTEFPAQEDTLQLLRDMVDMSVKVLGLDEQIENLREQMQSRREWLAAFMEEIDAFKQDLLGYIERSAANRQEQQKTLLAIAHSCSNQVNRAIKQGKAEVIAEQMISFGIDEADVFSFLEIARIYEGAFNLFELWADESDKSEKKKIISDLQNEKSRN